MPVIDQVITDKYALYHSDCMEVLPGLPAESIGLGIYSPPFPELYQYSDDPRDMTNCTSYDESMEQYRFVAREVSRLLIPGRLCAVHCTDLKRGMWYQRDFPGDVIRVHEDTGLHFFCRVTIWKDPWHFARRTRMKTLMHKTIVEDASKSRIAPADYLVVFKKPGVNPQPITHVDGFKEYAGQRGIPAEVARQYSPDQRSNGMSHWIYRQYASPVWMDIRRNRLMPFEEARENPEEKHVCPLQLDAIDRCIAMWSNPGDTILSPFAGVGSELHEAIRMGRKAIGCELKPTYFRQAKRNLENVDMRPIESEIGMDESETSESVEAEA
jgi:DNA modification methylase